MTSDLPLLSRRWDLLDLSLDRLVLLLDPLNALVLSDLLRMSDLTEQFSVWLVDLVFVVLRELSLFIEKSLVHGLNELVLVRLEASFE